MILLSQNSQFNKSNSVLNQATIFLLFSRVTCIEICEDSSLMAVGFSDSLLKVWSLIPQKLRVMKSAEQLSEIEKDAGKHFHNFSFNFQ